MAQGRTDRILIVAAALLLMLVTGAFYFDDWMWGHGRKRGEAIGQITDRHGDVRLKYEDELKWQRATTGHDLAYNDSIYSGAGGEAHLQVGQSRMTLSENTLIVLRRDSNINFLNLNYGTLLGKIARDDKVVVDVGAGPPVTLSASKPSDIILKREGRSTRLEVTSGEAKVTVNGKSTVVTRMQRVDLGQPELRAKPVSQAATKPAPPKVLRLRAITPVKEQTLVAAPPATIKFVWGWENDRPAGPTENYELEFANDIQFKHVHARRHVRGALETTMRVNQSLSLYYRVRGPNGELSSPAQVNYVALEKPLIVRPVASAVIENAQGESGLVTVEFRRPKPATVWYQIASDAEFRRVRINQNTPETVVTRDLGVGHYFLRARSDYGRGQLSDWTAGVPFELANKLVELPLAKAEFSGQVKIPNANYPSALYGAAPETISSFLARRGLLQHHFAGVGPFEEMKLLLDNHLQAQRDAAWPEAALKPGQHGYRYQLNKKGFLPSAWSPEHRLDIEMEPPRAIGRPEFGPVAADGRRPTKLKFTPLLFAKSYDVEVADNPRFTAPVQLTTPEPSARVRLEAGSTYYWRARARDGEGHLISAYSAAASVGHVPLAPPPVVAPPTPAAPPSPEILPLAKAEPAPERKPAAEDRPVARTQTRLEEGDIQKLPWKRAGWWAWFGSGENFVDYKQTLSGTAAIDSRNFKSGSEYVEAGYLGEGGVGGVLAYKNTPGAFDTAILKDGSGVVPITPNTYRWTTASIEAIAKRATARSLAGSPLTYGMRVGVQQHQVPFLSLNADATEIDQKNNQMTTASVGLLAEWLGHRWKHYSLVRYQFPLSTKADGASEFSLSPIFAFDGSVGTSYNLTERLKLGLFVYGQWHQMRFTYADASVNQQGTQSLFYSNVDLRLGFDF